MTHKSYQPYVITLFIAILLAIGAPAQAAMFGVNGQENSDLTPFIKWLQVKEKILNQAINLPPEMVQGLPAGVGLEQKLNIINNTVNRRIAYREDIAGWGVNDYWASPAETLAKGYGDCDDFAIMKYYLLLRQGVSAEDMQIVILTDTRQQILHAVLAVQAVGRNYILDNRRGEVYEDISIRHYQPIYAINGTRWWRYS